MISLQKARIEQHPSCQLNRLEAPGHHPFLIMESKVGPRNQARHVLYAESNNERNRQVNTLLQGQNRCKEVDFQHMRLSNDPSNYQRANMGIYCARLRAGERYHILGDTPLFISDSTWWNDESPSTPFKSKYAGPFRALVADAVHHHTVDSNVPLPIVVYRCIQFFEYQMPLQGS